jgi:NAD(P)H-hydrate epimerase
MAGAPALVGLAALRSGAGLVTIAAPAPVQPTVAALCPCATTLPLPATPAGQIDPSKSVQTLRRHGWLTRGSTPDALIVGPGIGLGNDRFARQLWTLIDAFRINAAVPAVIDADALNLARKSDRPAPNAWNLQPHGRTIITPHPGEMARLHGISIKQVQANRQDCAARTAHMMTRPHSSTNDGPVVVLKGAGTVVTDGRRVYVNRTGNPGMATGGSGDVLAGVLAGLLAQGMDLFDAAVLGVHVHGLAGDRAAEVIGQIPLIATDLINCLPVAFEEISSRRTKNKTSD